MCSRLRMEPGYPGVHERLNTCLANKGYLQHAYRTLTSPIAKIPGPWYSLWTDAVFKYYRMTGQGAPYVHRLHGKYGMCFHLLDRGNSPLGVAANHAIQRAHRSDKSRGSRHLRNPRSPDDPLHQGRVPQVVILLEAHRQGRRERLQRHRPRVTPPSPSAPVHAAVGVLHQSTRAGRQGQGFARGPEDKGRDGKPGRGRRVQVVLVLYHGRDR